jgi:predicted 2-oxoglutarate/Fe(II)-dependent dioxygenase YbiX
MEGGTLDYYEIAIGVYEAQFLTLALAEASINASLQETGWRAATIDNDDRVDVVDSTVRKAEVLCKSSAVNLLQPLNDKLHRETSALARSLAPFDATLSDVQIVRYRPGGFFTAHRDNPFDLLKGRVVTVLCYLNDDFAGGDITFPEVGLCYRPRAGFGIVFPSTYLHCAAAVADSDKFVLTGWYVAI